MALPASGPISFNAINVELGVAGTTTANINQASYRSLAGVPSGTISLSNFYGKSSLFAFNITSANSVNLRTAAIAAGWNQSSALQATIPAGNTIGSSSSGGAALDISGAFPGGLTLVNSGTIQGAGGGGGNGGYYWGFGAPIPAGDPHRGRPGSAGGTGIAISSPVSINNAGTIAGGGGGGGGGGWGQNNVPTPKGFNTSFPSGGGGGGGAGSIVGAGGAGGGGGDGNNGTPANPGSAGTSTTGGAGGATTPASISIPCTGGAGGARGTAGSPGQPGQPSNSPAQAGGAAGFYVTGNASVTWIATGTRIGSVS